MGAHGAHLSDEPAHAGPCGRLAAAGDPVDRAGGRRAAERPADPDVRRARPRSTLSIADRSGRWLWSLRPVAGFAWLMLLVLPWFAAIIAKSGTSFFAQCDRPGHAGQGDQRRRRRMARRPAITSLLFWVTFWPGSVLAGLAAPRVWQARREPGARFLLAWLIPSWVVFEAVITKLPHYVLPLYPAIAILIAGILEGGRSRDQALAGARHGRLVPLSRRRSRSRSSSASSSSAAISASSPGRSPPRRRSSACSPGGFMRWTAPSARCCAAWWRRCSSPSRSMP